MGSIFVTALVTPQPLSKVSDPSNSESEAHGAQEAQR